MLIFFLVKRYEAYFSNHICNLNDYHRDTKNGGQWYTGK